MASCGIVWVALYYKLRHGDPDGIYKARVFWLSVAALLYLSILVFNLYKTGWAMGLFGSLVQCSVYWILARYFYKPILLCFFLAPAAIAMWRFSGGHRTDTEIVYRTRNC